MKGSARFSESPHQVQIILRGSYFYFLNDAGGSWPVVEAIERPLEHALTDVATSCPLLESQAISRPAEDWEHWLRERRKADLQ